MTPDRIFSLVNLVALSSWVLLALLPRRRWIADVLAGMAVPAVLAAVYVAIVATKWAGSAGGFTSLSAVATLFSNPWLLLAGWTHYLAFDLFVGSWEVRNARERGVPHLLVLPCLALTFLFGPAGWMLYLAIRSRPWRRG
jgi:ABA4-like protein